MGFKRRGEGHEQEEENGIKDKIVRRYIEKGPGDDSPTWPSITEAGTFLSSSFGLLSFLAVWSCLLAVSFFFFLLGLGQRTR